ncbi:MAG: glycosyltransferase family 39 protein, partial [Planctomycetia bacterium]|nr:glycosyltransferase family 39 protein [Planctomycetia bacterium]
IMVVESKLATTDATLALFLVGGQFSLWELSRRPSKRWAALFWVLTGLATLTKGPVGPALVASAGVVSWWWGGPTTAWGRLHWRWGVPLFALVTAPWLVAVGVISRGEFFRFALGKQVAERVVSGVETHGGFPGYYLVTTLVLFHPWAGFLPAALRGAWSRRRASPEFGFLLGWVVGPWVLLECVRTKLVHYYLPSYPACALLTAWAAVAVARDGGTLRRWPLGRLGLGLLGGVAVVLTGAFVAGAAVISADLRWPCLAIGLVIGTGTLCGLSRLYRATTTRGVFGLAATWSLALLLLYGWMLPAAEPYRLTRVVGERLVRLADDSHTRPVLLSFQEPTVLYTMGRSVTLMRTWPQFYRVLDRDGVVASAIVDWEELATFRARGDLDIDIRETVSGFNFNKGYNQTLHLALIRRKALTRLARDPASVPRRFE